MAPRGHKAFSSDWIIWYAAILGGVTNGVYAAMRRNVMAAVETTSVTPLIRFLTNPWTVGIGTALVSSMILGFFGKGPIAWLIRWVQKNWAFWFRFNEKSKRIRGLQLPVGHSNNLRLEVKYGTFIAGGKTFDIKRLNIRFRRPSFFHPNDYDRTRASALVIKITKVKAELDICEESIECKITEILSNNPEESSWDIESPKSLTPRSVTITMDVWVSEKQWNDRWSGQFSLLAYELAPRPECFGRIKIKANRKYTGVRSF